MKALVMLIVASALAGCSKRAESTPESGEPIALASGSTEINTSVRTNRLTEREFFMPIYVPAYDAVGNKNPRWDEAARQFLGALAESAGTQTNDLIHEKRIADALWKVRVTRCEDPLVRYMIFRQTQDPHHAHEEGTNEWVQAAVDLNASEYHLYWKFFSNMRAAQALHSIDSRTPSYELAAFRRQATERLVELVKDYSLPTGVMYSAVYSWIIEHLGSVPNLRASAYESIEHHLREGWGDTAEMHQIRGAFYIKYAWDARGGGWADSVSADGWHLFAKRLSIARESLERSWLMKPLLQTALHMQWVEVGDSTGRKSMERWFANVTNLVPGHYEAHINKLTWLHPKWHGSEKEMLAFGRQALSDTNRTAAVTLYEAHLAISRWQARSKSDRDAYWKRPGVWSDVKLSFETYFKHHPEGIGWRHNYALAAYKAEAWDELRKQINLLGPINYQYFGGKEEFDEMVREAEEKGRL